MGHMVRRAWLALLGAALVVLVGSPAMASTGGARHTQPFQPVDTTSYAVAHSPSVVPGLLVWMSALTVILVVGVSVRRLQASRS